MPQLPFEIPESLASYAEHFEEEPLKATKRLKQQLKKRGPDAVGHFLLAWFYHLKGMNEQAVDEALNARIFAPGSPFFEKLHYYLSHPNAFEAWTPDPAAAKTGRPSSTPEKPGPVLDLDSLIQKLSKVDSAQIRSTGESPRQDRENRRKKADDIDDIVSETLASIHEKQGKMNAAIRTYRRLKELNKEKREYYSEQIARLEALQKRREKREEE